MLSITNKIFFSLTLFICINANIRAQYSNRIVFTGTPTSEEQTSPTTSDAFGIATLALDPTFDTSCVQVGWDGFTTPLQGIHIHRGAAGNNGGVVVDLGAFTDNNRVEGKVAHSQVPTTWLEEVLNNELYVNIHSANNPLGEIRGQLELDTDHLFYVELEQQGAGGGSGGGMATIRINKAKNEAILRLICNDFGSAVSSVKVYYGATGQQGVLLENITSSFNVSTGSLEYIPVTWDVNTVYDSLVNSSFYIEVELSGGGNAVFRGDFESINIGYFGIESSLDTLNQGESVVLNGNYQGSGLGYCLVSPNIDTLYSVFYNNLTASVASSAHYHELSTGNVLHDLSDGINGRWIRDTITGKLAVTSILRKMLEGNCYINVHTSTNPQGEVCGTMRKLPRDVYFSGLSTGHLGLGVSDAQGYAYVSRSIVSRDVEIAVILSNITDTSTTITMHDNMGTTYYATSIVQNIPNGAYILNTITASDLILNALTNEELSFIVRNDSFPNDGELIGDIRMNTGCDGVFTNIEQQTVTRETISVYPNPVSGLLSIELENISNKNIYCNLVDLRGVRLSTIELTDYNTLIDMTIYPSGCYFLQIYEEGCEKQVFKVLKE